MYDFEPILNGKARLAYQSTQKVKLELCKEIPFKWDKIVIIPPYTTADMLKRHKLANSKFIEKQLPELALDEERCILLFVDNNTIVKFSFVSRIPVDFNYIKGTDTIKIISKKMGCEQLYIENNRNRLSLSY
ncbi:hypothetical protein D9M68_787760 [compost metagenome]